MLNAGGFHFVEAQYQPGEEVPPHAHEAAQLCLNLRGGYIEQHAGTRLPCEPFTLILNPPGHVHADRFPGGGRCLSVAIPPTAWCDSESPARKIAMPAHAQRAVPTRFAFELLAELRARIGADTVTVETLVLSILDDLADRSGIEVGRASPPWLEQVRQRVHEEFGQPRSLRTLAQYAGVHRVHLARAFRAHYGCTIGQYLRQRRLEFAARELVVADLRLSEIALRAGFADQSHFTTVFQRFIGITPGVFRRRFASSRAPGLDVTDLQDSSRTGW